MNYDNCDIHGSIDDGSCPFNPHMTGITRREYYAGLLMSRFLEEWNDTELMARDRFLEASHEAFHCAEVMIEVGKYREWLGEQIRKENNGVNKRQNFARKSKNK